MLAANGALRSLAGLDPSYVTLLEDGIRPNPSRAVVEKKELRHRCAGTSSASCCSSARGDWPWTGADDAVTELLVALALAVLDGDYRPRKQHVRETVTTGATMRAT